MIPVQNTPLMPTIEVVGGDVATWAVKVDGRTIATCGNVAVARKAAERIRQTLEREARIAAIRALADYLEQNPDAPCAYVSAGWWANDAKPLATCASHMPGAKIDNRADYAVSVCVDFGARVKLAAMASRNCLRPRPIVHELPPELAALPITRAAR
jgi:hypothetical protein